MTPAEIVRWRLHNQHLQAAALGTPAEVARWLGAVQEQDLDGSLYAIGLRIRHCRLLAPYHQKRHRTHWT
jgi:hypothetical protein